MLHITEAAVIWPHFTSQTSLNSMLGMRVELTGGWGCGGCTGPRLLFHNMLARVHVNNATICQFINSSVLAHCDRAPVRRRLSVTHWHVVGEFDL